MDDIPASVESEVDGSKIMDNINELLLEKSFKIKDILWSKKDNG